MMFCARFSRLCLILFHNGSWSSRQSEKAWARILFIFIWLAFYVDVNVNDNPTANWTLQEEEQERVRRWERAKNLT